MTPKKNMSTGNGCAATTASGTRCRMPALRGERFCWAHHPNVAARRTAARRRGAKRQQAGKKAPRQWPATLRTEADLQALLDVGLAEVRDVRGARRSGLVLRLLDRALAVHDVLDTQKRIARLEEMLAV